MKQKSFNSFWLIYVFFIIMYIHITCNHYMQFVTRQQNIHTYVHDPIYGTLLHWYYAFLSNLVAKLLSHRVKTKCVFPITYKLLSFPLEELSHKVKTQYVYFRLHTNYFLFPWKIHEEISK